MRNRINGLLFFICIMLACTAQSNNPEDKGRPEKRGQEQSTSHARNNQASPRVEATHTSNNQVSAHVESTRAPQATHRTEQQTHAAVAPTRQERTTHERVTEERGTPRVSVFAFPVENNQNIHHQHHNYWHPRYNFYNHEYHFYPYINVASRVELSPNCVQVLFDGQIYYYDWCVFYIQTPGGYLAVPPPIGIIVNRISSHAVQVIIYGRLYYTYNDVYYEPVPGGYQVVEPLR